MDLVIACNLLDQGAVVFEQNEETQVVEQVGRCQYAAHQGFEFIELPEWVERDAVDGAPLHVALAIGRQRPHARFRAVGDDEDFVVLEDVRNLLFVRLNLVVGLPDVSSLIGWIFQFQ